MTSTLKRAIALINSMELCNAMVNRQIVPYDIRARFSVLAVVRHLL